LQTVIDPNLTLYTILIARTSQVDILPVTWQN